MNDPYLSYVTLRPKMHDSASSRRSASRLSPFVRKLWAGFICPTRESVTPPVRMSLAMTAWTALLLAGAFEIIAAFGLKQTDGFTRFWPSVGTLAAMALSFAFMAIAVKSIPFGTAYAVWCGIGVGGTVIVGTIVFGEPATAIRLLCAALIAAGIIGLKLADAQ